MSKWANFDQYFRRLLWVEKEWCVLWTRERFNPTLIRPLLETVVTRQIVQFDWLGTFQIKSRHRFSLLIQGHFSICHQKFSTFFSNFQAQSNFICILTLTFLLLFLSTFESVLFSFDFLPFFVRLKTPTLLTVFWQHLKFIFQVK